MNLLDIMEEIVNAYDEDEDIETKILEDLKQEIESVLYERATMIDSLSSSWGDGFHDED